MALNVLADFVYAELAFVESSLRVLKLQSVVDITSVQVCLKVARLDFFGGYFPSLSINYK